MNQTNEKVLFKGKAILSDWESILPTKRLVRDLNMPHVENLKKSIMSMHGKFDNVASITAMLEVSPDELLTITEGILLLLFLNKFLDQIQNEEFLKAHKASLIDGLHRKTACHLIYTRIKKMNSPNANIYRYRPCVWYFNLAEEEQISLSVNLNTLATITYKETPADLYFFLRFVIFNLLLILFRKTIWESILDRLKKETTLKSKVSFMDP